jgi:hypothetical protein
MPATLGLFKSLHVLLAASVPYRAEVRSFFLIVDYYCGSLSDPSYVAEAFKTPSSISSSVRCAIEAFLAMSSVRLKSQR